MPVANYWENSMGKPRIGACAISSLGPNVTCPREGTRDPSSTLIHQRNTHPPPFPLIRICLGVLMPIGQGELGLIVMRHSEVRNVRM